MRTATQGFHRNFTERRGVETTRRGPSEATAMNERLSETERHTRVLESWHDTDLAVFFDRLDELGKQIDGLTEQVNQMDEQLSQVVSHFNKLTDHVNQQTDRINGLIYHLNRQTEAMKRVLTEVLTSRAAPPTTSFDKVFTGAGSPPKAEAKRKQRRPRLKLVDNGEESQ